jgi:proline iminopeptidase
VIKNNEGRIPVPGGNVWYRIIGSDRPGVPLLVLHGGPGAPHDYLEPVGLLADERPVIFYDQLGCGNSDKPADVSLWKVSRFVDELAAVQAALGLDEAHLLGQSWGAMLAVEYCVSQRPQHVRSLILSGPFLSSSRWIADQRVYLALMPEDIQAKVRQAEATGDYDSQEYQQAVNDYYKRHLCRLEPWPDALNRTLANMGVPVYHTMCGPSEFTMLGNLKDVELVARLPEITAPVLFTCGRYDEATPETTALYQQALPGSDLFIFEDASHAHHLEKPAEYAGAVKEFLKRVEGVNPWLGSFLASKAAHAMG